MTYSTAHISIKKMAPKMAVPMDFGRHLLRSPTHNNLTLKTKEGGEVTASSVILSFNSPVIDHMTTTLHMTSVDMLEFSEAAVKMFVDSAYSGTADEITRETFRDLNKMSCVFEVEWLVEKCAEHFSGLPESNYADLLYLFEEGAYAYEIFKRKKLFKIGMKKIKSFSWKSKFLDKYLVNAGRLSTQKLDLVIELAGNDVESIVQILTRQLSELVLNQGLPTYCEYLLENSDLSLCRQSNKLLFDELFEMLDALPDEKMRWTFRLLKENSSNKVGDMMLNLHQNFEMGVSYEELRWSSGICNTNLEKMGQDPGNVIPFSTLFLIASKKTNTIPNLYRSFDMDMSFDEVYQWLLISDEVDSIILAIEAISTWNWYRCFKKSAKTVKFDVDLGTINDLLDGLCSIKEWSRLPYSFNAYSCLGGLSLSFLCNSSICEYSEFSYLESSSSLALDFGKGWLDALRFPTKFVFKFKSPFKECCNQPGQCGFILETVPSNLTLWKLRLCTEKEAYNSFFSDVHFHDEIRAENMHAYIVCRNKCDSILYPLTWLGFAVQKENDIVKNLSSLTDIDPKPDEHSCFLSFGVMYKF